MDKKDKEKTYEVSIDLSVEARCVVTAKSSEEAEDKVRDAEFRLELESDDVDVRDVDWDSPFVSDVDPDDEEDEEDDEDGD